MSIDIAIENSAASVEMEGFIIDDQCKDLCRKLLLHSHRSYVVCSTDGNLNTCNHCRILSRRVFLDSSDSAT